jgi:hypothetical protein
MVSKDFQEKKGIARSLAVEMLYTMIGGGGVGLDSEEVSDIFG